MIQQEKEWSKLIVNLSNYELSYTEKSLLGKGLSFCPVPPSPLEHDILTDLLLFECRVKLKYVHLSTPPPCGEEDDVYHAPTGWTPKINNPTLDEFLSTTTRNIHKSEKHRRPNLTTAE